MILQHAMSADLLAMYMYVLCYIAVPECTCAIVLCCHYSSSERVPRSRFSWNPCPTQMNEAFKSLDLRNKSSTALSTSSKKSAR